MWFQLIIRKIHQTTVSENLARLEYLKGAVNLISKWKRKTLLTKKGVFTW